MPRLYEQRMPKRSVAGMALALCMIGLPPAAQAASGKAQILHVFKGTPDGNYPSTRLMPLAGALYGLTAFGGEPCAASASGCGTVFEVVPSRKGDVVKTIYRFRGEPADGAEPGSGALVADQYGALYGTTQGGGNGNCDNFGLPGCGVVFKLTPTANGYAESVIYHFQGGRDGANPVYGVVLDADGNVFGTTSAGGDKNCPGGGCGVIYKLKNTPSGYQETVIHRFVGTDGTYPDAAPIIDAFGNLFGTTFDGGTGVCATYGGGCGTVYELSPGKGGYALTTLYNFQGGNDGVQVQSGLIADRSGNLFGMTTFGGTGPCAISGLPSGCGTIFKLAPTGAGYTETILHDFQGTDGSLPTGNLYRGLDGGLYGAAPYGGSGACSLFGIPGCGVLFTLSQSGGVTTEKVVYNFPVAGRAGNYPNDPLFDRTGFYDTTCCGTPTQRGALDWITLPR